MSTPRRSATEFRGQTAISPVRMMALGLTLSSRWPSLQHHCALAGENNDQLCAEAAHRSPSPPRESRLPYCFPKRQTTASASHQIPLVVLHQVLCRVISQIQVTLAKHLLQAGNQDPPKSQPDRRSQPWQPVTNRLISFEARSQCGSSKGEKKYRPENTSNKVQRVFNL